MTKKFHIQGHRGARGLLSENTIQSCIEAVKYGVDGLEIDVVVSKDGQIVVSHEPWMSPLFYSFPDGKPVIARHEASSLFLINLDYSEIKKYDCGSRGNPLFPSQKAKSLSLHLESRYKGLISPILYFPKNEKKLIENNLKKKVFP